jgi:ArsR family transcriptional regulator
MTSPSTRDATFFPSEEDFAATAELFKALSHPLRLKIVCGLLRLSDTQTGISRALGLPQSSIAQQIGVLRRAGIVRGRRVANEVHLEVADVRIPALFEAACTHGPG